MNDLTELKDGWGEPDPPSRAARATARNALMREIAATHTLEPAPRRRGGRLGWLVGGTVATAAAVVVAVVLSSAPPGRQDAQSSPPSGEPTGQQILLQAAEVAQAQPEGTGAYWHVAVEHPEPNSPGSVERSDEWISRDGGVHYTKLDGRPGVSRFIGNTGFFVRGSWLTLAQVEGLSTNSDELKAWLADAYLGQVPSEEVANRVASNLLNLLWKVPAPSAVRAAALRSLATMPNVTNLGAADGGQALRIFFGTGPADKFPDNKIPPGTGELVVVINPDTAMLISSTENEVTTKILAAVWTDDMPEIVPLG